MKAAAVIRRSASYLLAVGAGAAAMYWFDPDMGRSRQRTTAEAAFRMWSSVRHAVRRQLAHALRSAASALAEEPGLRRPQPAHGAEAASTSAQREEPAAAAVNAKPAGDDTLLEQVRTQLDQALEHAALLTVTVHDGWVIVSGPVRSGETLIVEQRLRELAGIAGLQLSPSEYERESDLPGLPGQQIWQEHYSW
ncbi:MAG TPA: BON domain-containing protein [Candidatus Eremiobacteraceae bacterium]|nr:BON domain-containing protein [Candidatus Eremiobacteraceae bacterium]